MFKEKEKFCDRPWKKGAETGFLDGFRLFSQGALKNPVSLRGKGRSLLGREIKLEPPQNPLGEEQPAMIKETGHSAVAVKRIRTTYCRFSINQSRTVLIARIGTPPSAPYFVCRAG